MGDRDDDSEFMSNDGDRVLEMRQNTEGGLDKIENKTATEGTVGSDHKDRAEGDEEEDLSLGSRRRGAA